MKNPIAYTKIFLVWILVVAIFLTMFPNKLVRATPETTVKVEPHASFVRVGETFIVNITVVNVQNLYGVEIVLHWNASILKVVGVDVRLGVESHPDGVLHEDILLVKNETMNDVGKYWLAATSYNKTMDGTPPPSFNGSGNVVRLTFNVIKAGSCELNLLESELASNLITSTGATPISHTTINGFFGPVEIKASPKVVTIGENVNVSGCIAPAKANVPVTILYRLDGEEWQTLETVNTDELGNYAYLWSPEKSGKYYVKSTAVILGSEETSSIVSIIVNKSEQPPWLYIGGIVVIIIGVILVLLVVYRRRIER